MLNRNGTGTVCLQIEREKADLSVQVIQLQERLEEAECGVEGQVIPHFFLKTS